ncbi:hypothetical protein QJL30_10535 [Clostridioides difficile]|uniref:Uncharacterized protein n=1 Tax=Clostridioides difficile TaxID=1496 RepID=A0A386JC47_CLODI|nr:MULTISPECIES: hypothetical protein [Clostridioides]EQF29798.1 hypothetical protein QEW_4571 [Clostridioides difficile CD160]AYD68746.1 hypothetical protein pHSJD-312_00125 [Clostridioides difficile]KPI52967.1 hypothetical protein KW95_04230 [Clostridioides difficile]KPI55169.1 hypothetical protein KW94_04000 [Clostridioides difficile]MDI2882238.1 hypothetical protein [Clostridioides difficile]
MLMVKEAKKLVKDENGDVKIKTIFIIAKNIKFLGYTVAQLVNAKPNEVVFLDTKPNEMFTKEKVISIYKCSVDDLIENM